MCGVYGQDRRERGGGGLEWKVQGPGPEGARTYLCHKSLLFPVSTVHFYDNLSASKAYLQESSTMMLTHHVRGRSKIHFVTDSGIWPLTSDTPSPST